MAIAARLSIVSPKDFFQASSARAATIVSTTAFSAGFLKPGHRSEPLIFEKTLMETNLLMDRLERIEEKLDSLIQQPLVKDFYSTAEVAKIVERSNFTVRQWCLNGPIRAEKRGSNLGRHFLIPPALRISERVSSSKCGPQEPVPEGVLQQKCSPMKSPIRSPIRWRADLYRSIRHKHQVSSSEWVTTRCLRQ